MLHVLNNLEVGGLRNAVLRYMNREGMRVAKTEVRYCAWLAQVDTHGGSIFDYRPYSKGAEDIPKLRREVLDCIRQTDKQVVGA